MMGMSGVQVYERKIGWLPAEHFFDIVWRDRVRWSLAYPWASQKHLLVEVGRKIRHRAAIDEEMEAALTKSEREKAEQERESADTLDVMTRDVVRTVSDKPLYYYN